jgi:hypothetical protein
MFVRDLPVFVLVVAALWPIDAARAASPAGLLDHAEAAVTNDAPDPHE